MVLLSVANSPTKGTLTTFVSTLSKGRHIEGRIQQQSEFQQEYTLHGSVNHKRQQTMVEKEYEREERGVSQPKLKPDKQGSKQGQG